MLSDAHTRHKEVYPKWIDDPNSFKRWCKKNGFKSGMHVSRKDTRKEFTPDNCYLTKNVKTANKDLNIKYLMMKRRCYDSGYEYRRYYIGKEVCDEWLRDYSLFEFWALENGYRKGLTLDRIDNDKGYFPENCRWVTNEDQQNNTRANIRIRIGDYVHTFAEWCKFTRSDYGKAYYLYRKGVDPKIIFGLA